MQEPYINDALEMIGMNKPKEIIQIVSGFVPVFEVLLEKYDDHITALVFGRRWQYCRMKDGVCTASLNTIAGDLKISPATVMRHTEKLVEDGYLIDLTPDLKNSPHTYADAGKVIMKSQLSAESVSQGNTGVSQRNATVSQSQVIKDLNRQVNKDDILFKPSTNELAEQEATRMFERAFQFGSLPWHSKTVWTKMAKFVTKLHQADPMAFGNYIVWRGGEGKYKAMSNKQIRMNPEIFMDTGWAEFEAEQKPKQETEYLRQL